ncbi:hypothetical protein BWR18_10835 [Tateyamaria omphalii]|uniref:S-adenosylmethionine tRNA ribosyltransferase n=1 Tax=Tateyamaria omphalii TaxID=299262 RepID=A0A1P8N0Z2_9RHOB|nr:hypothetical protein BWR18_10835 [Tateyamaria omphalii]
MRAAILEAVHARGAGKTICPSEVARALADDWRPLMGEVRRVAECLAAEGALVVMQKGRVVDVAQARGPVRLGVPRATDRP